jgi:hypothetical protein
MFEDLRIFVSVGSTSNHRQEAFLSAVEGRLRSEGLIPQTVGRNFFSSDAPLKTVTELMDSCAGAVIIALERKYFPAGVEKRGGPNEVKLSEVKFATPWNQIEAAMAYSRGLPLMVITEVGLWEEGLLDHGNEWYIQSVALDPSSLNSMEFNGVLASWKAKVRERKDLRRINAAQVENVADLTIKQLVSGLKPSQLWALLAAVTAFVVALLSVGARFGKLFGLPGS